MENYYQPLLAKTEAFLKKYDYADEAREFVGIMQQEIFLACFFAGFVLEGWYNSKVSYKVKFEHKRMKNILEMILLENVCKEFDTGFSLKNISITVEQGEKILVFGPNGAGKTTFLKILSCLLSPSSGNIKIMGYPPAKRKHILANIGFAPQSGHLYDSLTVKQNLEFYGKMYGIAKPQLEERMHKLLAQFNLTMKLDNKVSQLSKGMRQRLLIVKALLHDPQILLLDEPYAGLDLESAEYLHNYLESTEDKTVITATHDFNSEIKTGQRVIIFNQGSIVFDDRWQDDIATFKDFYKRKVGQ